MRRASILGSVAAALAAAGAPAPVAAATVQVAVSQAAPAASTGWLGIRSTATVHLDTGGGSSTISRLLVTQVFRGGPADVAGVEPGDVIVGLNGAPMISTRFQSLASRLQPGDPVAVTVVRGERRLEFALTAAPRPTAEVMVPRQLQVALDSTRRVFVARLDSLERKMEVDGAFPVVELRRIEADSVQAFEVRADGGARGFFEWAVPTRWNDSVRVPRVRIGRSPAPVITSNVDDPEAPVRPLALYRAGLNRVAGAEFTPLVDDLATYFQVDHGLLVTEVAEGTPAAAAGLIPGDVIVEARGQNVESIDALRAALSLRDGPVSLAVVRRGLRVELHLPR